MTEGREVGTVADVKSYFTIGRNAAYDLMEVAPWARKVGGQWRVDLRGMRLVVDLAQFQRQGRLGDLELEILIQRVGQLRLQPILNVVMLTRIHRHFVLVFVIRPGTGRADFPWPCRLKLL